MSTQSALRAMQPVSADSHIIEPPDCFSRYVDARYRDSCPHVVEDPQRGALFVIPGMEKGTFGLIGLSAAGLTPEQIKWEGGSFDQVYRGAYDPVARVTDMDRDGVAAELIYPSAGMVIYSHPDTGYQQACFQAYNRWLEGFIAGAPDRLFGIGTTAVRSVDELIRDMRDIHRKGFRGVMMPDLPEFADYDDPVFNPAWETAIELGLPLCFHILPMSKHTASPTASGMRGGRIQGFNAILRGNQDIVAVFVFGGVFERYPQLKIVCVESDAGWIPHYMNRMDHNYTRYRHVLKGTPLSRLPSDYVMDNVYVTFQDDRTAFGVTHLCNPGRFLWANDYPHGDATWPTSMSLLEEQTAGLDDQLVRRIVSDNTRELFRIGAAS